MTDNQNLSEGGVQESLLKTTPSDSLIHHIWKPKIESYNIVIFIHSFYLYSFFYVWSR